MTQHAHNGVLLISMPEFDAIRLWLPTLSARNALGNCDTCQLCSGAAGNCCDCFKSHSSLRVCGGYASHAPWAVWLPCVTMEFQLHQNK